MLLRPPPAPELVHAPPEFLWARDESVELPLGARVRSAALRRFIGRMSAHGSRVQSARLGYDRRYALDCLARAHAQDDAELRGLALELFAALHR